MILLHYECIFLICRYKTFTHHLGLQSKTLTYLVIVCACVCVFVCVSMCICSVYDTVLCVRACICVCVTWYVGRIFGGWGVSLHVCQCVCISVCVCVYMPVMLWEQEKMMHAQVKQGKVHANRSRTQTNKGVGA